ncbi:MAG: hypothetical protein ACC651_17310 [Candidatus Scalindua sp.]
MLNSVNYKNILFVSFFISIIISVWSIYDDPTINRDALLYLNSAELYIDGRWIEGLRAWNWPFYPFLISIIGSATNLSAEHSAYILNTLLWSVVVLSFIALTKEMGGTLRHILAAAIIILVFTKINNYRDYIIRDAGYIAFYLLGFLYFLRYKHDDSWFNAMAWSFFFLLAALFRSEGFIFLFFVPVVLLTDRDQEFIQRLRMFFKANTLLISLLIVVPFTIFLTGVSIEKLAISNKLAIVSQTYGSEFINRIELVNKYLLNSFSEKYGWLVVIFTVLIIIVYKSIATLGVLYGSLALHGIITKAYNPEIKRKKIWLWFIAINIVILVLFASMQFFLTGRYVLALLLTIMLITPFSLVRIFDHWKNRKLDSSITQKYLLPVVVLLMIAMLVNGLVSFSPSKLYIKEAGLWIKNNTTADSTLYSNDQIINYYAGKEYSYITPVKLSEAKNKYDYSAINIKFKDLELINKLSEEIKSEPIKMFSNTKGDTIILFKNITG